MFYGMNSMWQRFNTVLIGLSSVPFAIVKIPMGKWNNEGVVTYIGG